MIELNGTMLFVVWFLAALVWHGAYHGWMVRHKELIASQGLMVKTLIDIFKQAVPITTFVLLDLSKVVLGWFGVTI